ncbi:MAG: serine hydrolase [Acidobacteria bacterium]|nr:serine hydrolase [Acidobacteriota bacterium]
MPRPPLRSRIAVCVAAAACLAIALAVVTPARQRATAEGRLDLIFEPWSARGAPGCAVSVMRGGDILFAKGYGDANLEYDVPITPSSVFHVASVSKQFTALAVALLVADGRVSWNDDIRRYVPELPDFGDTITLRHLAHHTSGIRDQWSLLQMAGWRWEGDVITQDDVLALLSRQTGVHFRPGSDYLYSNSGYTLLAVVVERVSGRTLREFTTERLFEPLGMRQTTFRDDHTMLVRNRAYAYESDRAGGYRLSIPDFAVVGASSLFTTVQDLARWNRNFRTGEVGGRDVLRQLQELGTLAGGARISYGFGLMHGMHRGRSTIGHGGTDAGYRGEFLRFPDEDLGVAVLCNIRTADPGRLARDVADVFLPAAADTAAGRRTRNRPGSPAARSANGDAPRAAPDRQALAALAGFYRRTEHDIPLQILARGDALLLVEGGAGRPLRPLPDGRSSAEGRFRIAGTNGLATFESGDDGTETTLRLSGPLRGVYTHAAPVVRLPAERLAEYAGSYHSDDLDVQYVFREEDRRLVLSHRKLGRIRLIPTFEDGFYGGGWYITFLRDREEVTGFTMSTSRAWKVPFRKVG